MLVPLGASRLASYYGLAYFFGYSTVSSRENLKVGMTRLNAHGVEAHPAILLE